MNKRYSTREHMYHDLLSYSFDPADANITSWVRSFLAIVLVTRESIPLEALVPLISSACNLSEEDRLSFRRTTRRLAQLFANRDVKDRHVVLPQGALRKVLAEQPGASPFFPDVHTHEEIAAACLHIMERELRFNICGLSSSFVRNVDVEDLEDRVAANIPPHLRLACCTWTHHISQLRALEPALVHMISDFFRFHVLFWLEAMSLMKKSAEETLTQLNTTNVRRKSCFYAHVTHPL
jgi:hypothetical protein